MNIRLCIGAAALVVIAAWGLADARPDTSAMEQGRRYTGWLYQKRYARLWQRMTPEMQGLFATPAEFGSFAGRALARVGPELRMADEDLTESAGERVYSRTASFSSAPRPLLLQWVLTKDGEVSGFAVRPVEADSLDSIAVGD